MLSRGDFDCPLRHDVPIIDVLVGPDLVQLLRTGIRGNRHYVFLPESLQPSSLSSSVHEDALTVPTPVIKVFDKYLHPRNRRFPRRDIHRVVWGWQRKVVLARVEGR